MPPLPLALPHPKKVRSLYSLIGRKLFQYFKGIAGMEAVSKLTDKEFWDGFFNDTSTAAIEAISFADVFEAYLEADPDKSVLEVGCAGGTFLAHIAGKYNYKAYGVDISDQIDQTQKLFQYHDIPLPELYQTDFFDWEPQNLFDLVCSFGFIEHFTDTEKVIKKHCDLTKPEGHIIITLPNFRRLQWFFHRLIEPETLTYHNLKVMDLQILRRALDPLPLEILQLGYYGIFGFWTVHPVTSPVKKFFNNRIQQSRKFWKRIFRYRPNPWVSPHIVLVAKKKAQ